MFSPLSNTTSFLSAIISCLLCMTQAFIIYKYSLQIFSSICLKDQVGDLLPQLLQLQEGLQLYGLLDSLRQHPSIWEVAFVAGKGIEVTANSLLENFEVLHSDQQMKRESEADAYMFFCDFIHSVHMNGKPRIILIHRLSTYHTLHTVHPMSI